MDNNLPSAGASVSSIVINTYDGNTHTIDFKKGSTVIAGVVSSDELVGTKVPFSSELIGAEVAFSSEPVGAGVVKFNRILINSKVDAGINIQSTINYEQ